MEKNESALKKYESIKSFYKGFISGEDMFPVEECRNEGDWGVNVFEGENYYYIIVCDDISDAFNYIEKAKPYIHINENSEQSYGWVSVDGNVISCAFKPVSNIESEYACAWRIAE